MGVPESLSNNNDSIEQERQCRRSRRALAGYRLGKKRPFNPDDMTAHSMTHHMPVEVCEAISRAKKGKPSNNPTGKRKGAPWIPKVRMRRAIARVLKRVCSRCICHIEYVAMQNRVERTVDSTRPVDSCPVRATDSTQAAGHSETKDLTK